MSDTCSVRADWLCMGWPCCLAEMRQEFQTGGNFFCTTLYVHDRWATNIKKHSLRLWILIIFFTPSLGFFNSGWHMRMGQIPARNSRPADSDYLYLYDIQQDGSVLLFGDAWKHFQTRSDEATQMPQFARAFIPIAIFVAHIIIASFVISRIEPRLNQNCNSKLTNSDFYLL